MNQAVLTDGLRGTRLMLAAVSIYIGMICANLDMVILQNALPSLTHELGIVSSDAVWVVTLYMLVMLILLMPVSSLSDRIGYKRTYLWGVGLFALASLGCGLAPGFTSLQIGRGLQGVGAAAMMSCTTSLIRLVYPRERMARAIAANATVVAISLAAGPSLAAVILLHLNWHWLFWLNVPLGIIAMLLGYYALPDNTQQLPLRLDRVSLGQWRKAVAMIDGPSFVMSAVFFVLLLLGSDHISQQPLIGSLALAAAALFGWGFVRREKRTPFPMLPMDLLSKRDYALTILTSFASFTAQGAAFVALPFFLQHRMQLSLAESALVMTAWPVALAVAAPLAARISQRYAISKVCAAGLTMLATGLVAVASGWLPAAAEWLMIPLAMCGAGFGLFQAPNNYLIIAAAPAERSGAVGGLRAVTRVFGQLTGAAMVGLLFALSSNGGTNGSVSGLLLAALLAAIGALASMTRRA
jgi:DHA2 family multidrug resistance protein-like MFS transporter